MFLAGRCTVLNAAVCGKVKVWLPEPETPACKMRGDYDPARGYSEEKPPNILQ